jgi:carbon monoxide dehydrogenase subunit G
VILGIAIAFQPSHGHIEKSILINAPASAVFPEVSNFKNFTAWSPWSKMDPEVKQTFEGPDAAVGSKMSWDGPKTGTGSQWIEEIEENKRVKNGMSFGGYDAKYTSEFILEPEGEGTKVTWTYDGPNDGVMGKAMWLMMGSMLNSQYEEGLAELKRIVESK